MQIEQETVRKTVWDFDPAHTLIEFSVKHMMVTTVRGRFTEFEGHIIGDVKRPTDAKGTVKIQAASINTGNEQRDQHLRSADFLDVEHYPTIDFVSKHIEQVSNNHFRVTGDVTIRGITKEVEIDAAVNGVGKSPFGTEVMGISAETILTRQDFGLTWNVALETGGVLVGDTVKCSMEIEAVKREGQPAEEARQEAASTV